LQDKKTTHAGGSADETVDVVVDDPYCGNSQYTAIALIVRSVHRSTMCQLWQTVV